MQINFNNSNGKESVSKLTKGDYESMLKERAKHLDHFREGIQEILSDYDGTNICIIVMKEDENGLPEGNKIFMGGMGRPEVQIALSKALHEASHEAIDLLIQAAEGDVDALLSLSKQLVNFMKGDV